MVQWMQKCMMHLSSHECLLVSSGRDHIACSALNSLFVEMQASMQAEGGSTGGGSAETGEE